MYAIVYTTQAQKDAKKIGATNLQNKVEKLLEIIKHDPFVFPPFYEILQGDFKGLISRRINIQHRLVYQVYEQEKIIKVIRMWTHYE